MAAPNTSGKNELLDWNLHADNKIIKILTSDIAGEAWVEFINENGDRSEDTNAAKRFTDYIINGAKNIVSPGKKDLSNIYNLLENSSCILVLINLADIIDSGRNGSIQEWMPGAIQNYIKKVNKKINMAIVLTQIDKYKHFYNECGQSWENVITEYAPSLNQVLKKHSTLIPVAAVADTKTDEDGNLIPSDDFKSEGLTELLNWISHEFSKRRKRKLIGNIGCVLAMPCILFLLIKVFLILYPRLSGSNAFLVALILFLPYFSFIVLLIRQKVKQ